MADDPRLAVLLPAAGASRRLGRPKQLLEIGGEALVRRTARRALALQPASLIVTTGSEHAAVCEALSDLPVMTVYNAAWASGLGGSIAAGARAVEAPVDGVLVLLCDQWRVTVEDLAELERRWREDPTRALAARWGKHFGPPVIFPATSLPDLCALSGERGARSLLERDRAACRLVDLENAGFDLDMPGDLVKATGSNEI